MSVNSGHEMDLVVERAIDRANHLEDALHDLTRARARVTHDSGLVSVQVDENGGMSGLWISESIAHVDSRELAAMITATAARAAQMVADRREQILASLQASFTD
ncbi:YbaB/EbfC family nucleoid-associated protein [Rhodococcus maanshanensis]|uniref:YbaB/EbfC DNA-binding family protein n=1 Tax=Rhodococcus maanshanensis TaxID=183556 RepID=A0A1H7XPJ0_9NOCA|nr:YbaB/EbfC family nucleoid-associated protein [Rhodococcus maanshanensis]SEM35097.1 YbaB/EbfC DNA-binding family protein [Rhodococcus maanshanensis]